MVSKWIALLFLLPAAAGNVAAQGEPSCIDAECHGPLLVRATVHAAAADGEDHDFASVPDPVSELCLAVEANREGFDPPRVPLFETVRGHPNIKHPVTGVPDPTTDGESLNCASCHDPHASKHASLLIGGSGFGNCKRCHTR